MLYILNLLTIISKSDVIDVYTYKINDSTIYPFAFIYPFLLFFLIVGILCISSYIVIKKFKIKRK